MTIGGIARRIGIRTSAIRYYESEGLLRSARLANGYRVYGDAALSTLRFIRRAQNLGITLTEIKELLRLSGQGHPPCKRVRNLTRVHLRDIDRKIRELTALRAELRRLLERRPTPRRDGEVCPIIEREISRTGGGSPFAPFPPPRGRDQIWGTRPTVATDSRA